MCAHGCMDFSTCVYITAFVCACLCICTHDHMCISDVYMCTRHLLLCVKCRENKGFPCLGPECIGCTNTPIPACIATRQSSQPGTLYPQLFNLISLNVLRTLGSQGAPMHTQLIPFLGFPSHPFSGPGCSFFCPRSPGICLFFKV